MKDVNYFLKEASFRSQQGFEFVFADCIEVFDQHETTLTTEDEKTMTITWNMAGWFKSYHILDNNTNKIQQVIDTLKQIGVDGETMHHIIRQVGMEEQMLRQLVLGNPYTDTTDLLEEKILLSNAGSHF
jgi:predicted aconitase